MLKLSSLIEIYVSLEHGPGKGFNKSNRDQELLFWGGCRFPFLWQGVYVASICFNDHL